MKADVTGLAQKHELVSAPVLAYLAHRVHADIPGMSTAARMCVITRLTAKALRTAARHSGRSKTIPHPLQLAPRKIHPCGPYKRREMGAGTRAHKLNGPGAAGRWKTRSLTPSLLHARQAAPAEAAAREWACSSRGSWILGYWRFVRRRALLQPSMGGTDDENAPAVKPGGTVSAGGFRKKQQPHEIGA